MLRSRRGLGMGATEEKTVKRLSEKSQEAFLLAVELYNRPTIKYRVEGCAFFLCNAWELLLKAYLIKRDGNQSIYYANKPGRTLSLDDCVKKVFTNKNDPLGGIWSESSSLGTQARTLLSRSSRASTLRCSRRALRTTMRRLASYLVSKSAI